MMCSRNCQRPAVSTISRLASTSIPATTPGTRRWGAVAHKDPAKQEAYNQVFRQQLTEVLTRYGKITEVWFDGSCVIDVSDILQQHAADAVIFQGPQATIRWPGTESGKLPYPAWNSLLSQDLKTGTATAVHGNPDGDAWRRSKPTPRSTTTTGSGRPPTKRSARAWRS